MACYFCDPDASDFRMCYASVLAFRNESGLRDAMRDAEKVMTCNPLICSCLTHDHRTSCRASLLSASAAATCGCSPPTSARFPPAAPITCTRSF